MPLQLIRNDISKVHADAIVNPTNIYLKAGGGVSEAIFTAAGKKELQKECEKIGYCSVGNAKITKAYKLNAKYIIHTVGPVWKDGNSNEEKLLSDCYNNCLMLAKQYNFESIAFPIISSGNFGYPKDKALKVALSCFNEFLLDNEIIIYLVIYDKTSLLISERIFSSIKQFIDDNNVQENTLSHGTSIYSSWFVSGAIGNLYHKKNKIEIEIDVVLNSLGDSFSQKLLKLIDEKGLNDVETYKKANIDRRTFSKIRSDLNYKPSKSTVIAFSIALELTLEETKDLLESAGYALSHSYLFDVIIEYYITNKNYNIYEINLTLFSLNQNTLGA
ncbi:macro domain-containing protein [Sedimentibacter sp. B4]|uniref:macro domain-containing protein n=1 Tax=Sedimentibacter sp. B4 TaxID=304766 RepID=UPI0002F04A29|nr:macro domain-containing protein [Sedimentibacter sp. B4]